MQAKFFFIITQEEKQTTWKDELVSISLMVNLFKCLIIILDFIYVDVIIDCIC